MSVEEQEAFVEEATMEEEAFNADMRKRLEDQLKATKCFKELLIGKEKEWEEVKKEVKSHIYTILMVGNEVVSRDFLAGIKHCIELFDARCEEFETAFTKLGGN